MDISDLWGGSLPGEVCEAPAAALALRVDVGDHELALAPHDQLRVVLEVVHLRETESQQVQVGSEINVTVGRYPATPGLGNGAGMVRYGRVWYGMGRYGGVWWGMVWHCVLR